jgi:hypothetical protein
MLKFTQFSHTLTRSIKYNYIPPSSYDILVKPNPVVRVTVGHDEGAYCDLHFRVSLSFYFSYSKTLYPKLHKIINDCCLELANTKIEL